MKDIQISAFGLGDDFDQVLMKGIADIGIYLKKFHSGLNTYLLTLKGVGIYFYVKNSDLIPAFVEFALNFLKKSVVCNAVLKLRGTGNSFVTKIYGDHDLVKGANLGIF